MFGEPQEQHRWLEKLVGEWTFESEGICNPGEPPFKSQGVERVRSLGGLWVIGEGEGEMPGGGTGRMIITLGYDPKKGRFVGTFVGSMMTHLWIYDGTLDPGGRVLTLNAEGPTMSGDGMARYQDIVEMKSDDHRVLTSRVQGADGKWTEFMTAHYRRKR